MLAAASRSPAKGSFRRAASTLALKYSNALYSAALKQSPQTLSKVQTDLDAVHKTIKDSLEVSNFIKDPTLSVKDRSAGLSALFKAAEGTAAKKEPVSDITKNFFHLLAENGRLGETQGVIEGFNELVSKYKGELTVTITSAAPLPKDIQSKLESTLKQSQTAQQAKTLKVVNKVREKQDGDTKISTKMCL